MQTEKKDIGWRTTDDGRRIYLNGDGHITKGNPHLLAAAKKKGAKVHHSADKDDYFVSRDYLDPKNVTLIFRDGRKEKVPKDDPRAKKYEQAEEAFMSDIIARINSVIEASKEGVEAYGVKGVKSTKWRKVFKSIDAMNAWAEKNDAEIQGTRSVGEPKTEAVNVIGHHPTKKAAHAAGKAMRAKGRQVYVMRGDHAAKHLGVQGVHPKHHVVYERAS